MKLKWNKPQIKLNLFVRRFSKMNLIGLAPFGRAIRMAVALLRHPGVGVAKCVSSNTVFPTSFTYFTSTGLIASQ